MVNESKREKPIFEWLTKYPYSLYRHILICYTIAKREVTLKFLSYSVW